MPAILHIYVPLHCYMYIYMVHIYMKKGENATFMYHASWYTYTGEID